jgi:DNA-binding PadR family transcriptional regulator
MFFSVYRSLDNLAIQGLVEKIEDEEGFSGNYIDTESNRTTHHKYAYKLTEDGKRLVEENLADWKTLLKDMEGDSDFCNNLDYNLQTEEDAKRLVDSKNKEGKA